MYGNSLMLGAVLRCQSQHIGQGHIAMLGNKAGKQAVADGLACRALMAQAPPSKAKH